MQMLKDDLVQKWMLTKQNMSLHEETNIGLRAIKALVEGGGGVHEIPIALGLLKIANNSHRVYMEHPKQENTKKRQKEADKWNQEAYRRRFYEIRAEERSLHEKLEQLKAEQTAEFGRQQQSEANKKLSEISGERDKIVSQLFKIGKTKNLNFKWKCSSET